MARPTVDAIDAFMRITGASESLALRKLEEYAGNLDAAVNAHFREIEGHVRNQVSPTVSPRDNIPQTENQMQPGKRGILPLLSAARSFRPSLLLDPNYRRNLFNQIGASVLPNTGPRLSHSGDQFNYGNGQPYRPGPGPGIESVSGTSLAHGSEIHGSSAMNAESHLYGNDIEDEMIQMAIEASNQERQLLLEDDELARAISLSLKTAEQETHEWTLKEQKQRLGVHDSSGRTTKTSNDRWKNLKPGSSSSYKGAEEVHKELLWGGISSKELDEAILLEEALFGETPKGTLVRRAPGLRDVSDKSMGLNPEHIPPCPSPSNLAQQLLQQQDDEYLASVLAEREKEVGVVRGAEISCSKGGEFRNKMLEGEEFERLLAAKKASLPMEPALDDQNAVTLLVRMPDGSRHGRRFLKSDKLQFLFDFIDVGRAVKPGTYRMVRPYPRRAFSVGDISLSLNELGLTNKQEALFLELI